MLKKIFVFLVGSLIFVSGETFSYKVYIQNDADAHEKPSTVKVMLAHFGTTPNSSEPLLLSHQPFELSSNHIPNKGERRKVYEDDIWTQEEMEVFLEQALSSGIIAIDPEEEAKNEENAREKLVDNVFNQVTSAYQNGNIFNVFPHITGSLITVEIERAQQTVRHFQRVLIGPKSQITIHFSEALYGENGISISLRTLSSENGM